MQVTRRYHIKKFWMSRHMGCHQSPMLAIQGQRIVSLMSENSTRIMVPCLGMSFWLPTTTWLRHLISNPLFSIVEFAQVFLNETRHFLHTKVHTIHVYVEATNRTENQQSLNLPRFIPRFPVGVSSYLVGLL